MGHRERLAPGLEPGGMHGTGVIMKYRENFSLKQLRQLRRDLFKEWERQALLHLLLAVAGIGRDGAVAHDAPRRMAASHCL